MPGFFIGDRIRPFVILTLMSSTPSARQADFIYLSGVMDAYQNGVKTVLPPESFARPADQLA